MMKSRRGEILINLLHTSDCSGAARRHVLLCCAVRNNDPWLCEPLVSKWLGWSPRIPDACCHRDKYAARRRPACHSPLLPPPPLGLHPYRNCRCCVFKLILCAAVVVTVVAPVVPRGQKPREGDETLPSKAGLSRSSRQTPTERLSTKLTYFHPISQQCEMGPHERARLTLQRGALFKKAP